MTPPELTEHLVAIERERLRSLVEADMGVAALRYRSVIDIAVRGQRPGVLHCWHLDCYRRGGGDGRWQVRWSHATEIATRISDGA